MRYSCTVPWISLARVQARLLPVNRFMVLGCTASVMSGRSHLLDVESERVAAVGSRLSPCVQENLTRVTGVELLWHSSRGASTQRENREVRPVEIRSQGCGQKTHKWEAAWQ